MKKFFYIALMALTVGMFASCSGSAGSSSMYSDGKKPEIDYEKGTINGKTYDNETYACWKVTVKSSSMGFSYSEDVYMWGTEWLLVAAYEESMAEIAKEAEGLVKASYSYSKADKYTDSESCLENNDDGEDDYE